MVAVIMVAIIVVVAKAIATTVTVIVVIVTIIKTKQMDVILIPVENFYMDIKKYMWIMHIQFPVWQVYGFFIYPVYLYYKEKM